VLQRCSVVSAHQVVVVNSLLNQPGWQHQGAQLLLMNTLCQAAMVTPFIIVTLAWTVGRLRPV